MMHFRLEMTICMQQNILHLTGRTQTGPITTSKYKHAMDVMIQIIFVEIVMSLNDIKI